MVWKCILGHKKGMQVYAIITGNCSSFSALCSVGSVILHVFMKFQGTPDFKFFVWLSL